MGLKNNNLEVQLGLLIAIILVSSPTRSWDDIAPMFYGEIYQPKVDPQEKVDPTAGRSGFSMTQISIALQCEAPVR